MFHLVKLVFLLSILSGTANAQWGTVVAQNDTNRFITSQYKYGLVMPHQNVIVGNLDTTITSVGIGGGNAYKVIVGSLLDYEDNCVNYSIVNGVASCEGSYELWREMEKSTGWYQAARGDTTAMFPTNYAVTISTGQDSVNIWNRDTAELWMAFKVATGNHIFTGTQNEIEFKDGRLYSASTGGLFVEDFLTERASIYNVGGFAIYEGGFQSRNKGGTGLFITYSTAIALAASSTNSVAVTRDPFGLKDALGRPDHWWIVSSPSNGGGSLYNPYTNTIYDQGATSGDFNIFSVSDRGQIWGASNNSGGYDKLSMMGNAGNNTIFGQTGDGLTPQVNYAGDSAKGEEKLAWTTGINGTKILASNNRSSIVGDNADNAYAWCDEGAYILSPSGGFGAQPTTNFAKQRWSSTVNAPVEFGDNIVAMAFEDNTTDSSPYGNTFTAANSPGTATAVFGNGYSGTVGSYTSHDNDADFNLANLAPMSVTLWVKRGTEANFLNETIWWLSASDAYPYSYMTLVGSGYLMTSVSDGSNNESATTNFAINDGLWHHLAMVWEGCSGCALRLYVDGVEVASDESITTRSAAFDDLDIGNHAGISNRYFRGMIDDFTLSHTLITPEAIAKLHAEGRKKLAMGTPVFTRTPDDALLSNNVVEVDALDNGMWAVAFSDANTVQVFDGRIPVQQIAAPAGTVKSLALIQSPGTDSVGVAIGTTTNLKFVQPSVNLRAAMAHQYQEPIHVGESVVVDSSGVGGIFWTGNDAINAGANANRSHIKFATGTYGKFSADKDGQWIQGSGQGHTYTLGGAPTTLIDGGTSGHAIDVSGVGVVLSDLSAQTDEGAGNAFSAIHLSGGQNQVVRDIIIPESDLHGISQTATASTSLFTNIRVYDADNYAMLLQGGASQAIGNFVGSAGADGIYVGGVRMVVEGNYINPNTNDGIRCDSAGDNSVFVGNLIHDGGGITLNSGCDYSIVDGNASDGGVSNNGSNNVIGDNVTY
mgnify:FL=1